MARYDNLMNGYSNDSQADIDNKITDDTASGIYDILVDISNCDIHDFDDFKHSYNAINDILTNASSDYNLIDINLVKRLSLALDSMVDDYRNYNATDNQNEKENAFNDFLHDMNIITDYKDSYKDQNYEPAVLLDI